MGNQVGVDSIDVKSDAKTKPKDNRTHELRAYGNAMKDGIERWLDAGMDDYVNFGGRINPQTSFEAWNETVSGKSISWRFEIEGANLLNRIVFETCDSNQNCYDLSMASSKKRTT